MSSKHQCASAGCVCLSIWHCFKLTSVRCLHRSVSWWYHVFVCLFSWIHSSLTSLSPPAPSAHAGEIWVGWASVASVSPAPCRGQIKNYTCCISHIISGWIARNVSGLMGFKQIFTKTGLDETNIRLIITVTSWFRPHDSKVSVCECEPDSSVTLFPHSACFRV